MCECVVRVYAFYCILFHSVLTFPKHSCDYRSPCQTHSNASVSTSNGNLAKKHRHFCSMKTSSRFGVCKRRSAIDVLCIQIDLHRFNSVSHTRTRSTSNVFLSSFKTFGCTKYSLAVSFRTNKKMVFIHFLWNSLSSDTDIKNIVDQWKRSDFLTESKGERRATHRMLLQFRGIIILRFNPF